MKEATTAVSGFQVTVDEWRIMQEGERILRSILLDSMEQKGMQVPKSCINTLSGVAGRVPNVQNLRKHLRERHEVYDTTMGKMAQPWSPQVHLRTGRCPSIYSVSLHVGRSNHL